MPLLDLIEKGQHFSSAGPFLLLVLALKPGLFKKYALWTSFEIEVIMMAGEGTF